MNEVIEVVTKKYAQFTGRARRREYWMFTVAYGIVNIILTVLDNALGLSTGNTLNDVGVFSGLFALAMLIPHLAVSVRRLHDTGRSGWWILLGLIPFLGWIALIIFMATDGQAGSNKWGPNPKAPAGRTPVPAQNW
ncbi:DUF805 domain-containing protein [Deinococcus sp. JMULE3]|uniref:DUF805 domain-containing protein n=1 Tax=Deinococcus sp. JMULE3 TaxID=2518341 RepID=UPI001576E872|nr:DUF805 domain-containing protein [Deinococcus sp. JMULE3]NTY01660.1 DUF805 domain-containing protein [Deinococcus sp. JMULE3]